MNIMTFVTRCPLLLFFVTKFIKKCLYVSVTMFYHTAYQLLINHIGGVMVSVLASSAVGRGFEPRLGQTKHYEIGICFLILR